MRQRSKGDLVIDHLKKGSFRSRLACKPYATNRCVLYRLNDFVWKKG